MYKKRNRKTLRRIGYFASVMILIFNLSAATFMSVAEAAAGQTLTMDKLQYLKGEAITLSYTGAGASGTDWVGIYNTGAIPPGAGVSITWTYLKSGDGKASLSNGLAPGTYDALFMLNDGYEIVDRKTFEVVDHVPVNGVTLDQQNVTMTEGETVTLTATVTPANANDPQVSWTSSDPAVVSVTATGGSASLTGNSPGTAIVTVTTADGNFTSSASVTVEAGLTLQNIIENAQAKYDAAVEGNEDGLYAAGSKAQLQSAIDVANATANDSNAMPEQVNQAKAALKAAIQQFDKQKISADLNGDGKISAGDLAIVAGGYGKQPDQAGWNEKADVNHDGMVDVVDLQIVAKASLQ
ncbi:Ig-like domain-containing protein [Paenibacillus sp. KQZ6P-2]|uniref:Ig-like domain-containing protein n=1 Tax=Paenibacillus mangrovi TaxID=2931978 RepID=A0A9X1WPV3_9BACL|nr:Ig-like domain-containing protein [Paenibacillus mangrovi]MCJ8011503.1 Ig-like domain-containing protein [Paenibacillus mangrovi]